MVIQLVFLLIAAIILVIAMNFVKTDYDNKSKWILFGSAVSIAIITIFSSYTFGLFVSLLLVMLVIGLISILIFPRLSKVGDDQYDDIRFVAPIDEEKNVGDNARVAGEEWKERNTSVNANPYPGRTVEMESEQKDDEIEERMEVQEERVETFEEDNGALEPISETAQPAPSIPLEESELDFEDELLANRRSIMEEERLDNDTGQIYEEDPNRNFEDLRELDEQEVSEEEKESNPEERSIDFDMDDFEIPELDLEEDSYKQGGE
ncbi:hypothetical protein [Halobacillus salinus]|uniref:hypothetical protein n=1 Tax=Halobacillus salinus TaxID=192814 RepID=UPI0009A6D12E|nr:hypothetical protein [Halobacillus salinus]